MYANKTMWMKRVKWNKQHKMEALMETLLFNYGVGNAYTQPQVQNQSYQHMNQVWVNPM